MVGSVALHVSDMVVIIQEGLRDGTSAPTDQGKLLLGSSPVCPRALAGVT